MRRMFYYLMVIFGIILASLLPKCSIIRYLRWHLGFSDLLWCHFWHLLIQKQVSLASLVPHFWNFGIFDIFGVLASWDSKVHIIRDQRCLGFGIFALSWCQLLGLMMPKCQKCQEDKKKMPKPENEWKPPIFLKNRKKSSKTAKTPKCLEVCQN